MDDRCRHVPHRTGLHFDRVAAVGTKLPAQDALCDVRIAVPLAVVVPRRRSTGCEAQEADPALVVVKLLFANDAGREARGDRKSTRLNSSHLVISYAVFCLKKKKRTRTSQ